MSQNCAQSDVEYCYWQTFQNSTVNCQMTILIYS